MLIYADYRKLTLIDELNSVSKCYVKIAKKKIFLENFFFQKHLKMVKNANN